MYWALHPFPTNLAELTSLYHQKQQSVVVIVFIRNSNNSKNYINADVPMKTKSLLVNFFEITQDITILDRYRGLYKPKRMGKNVSDLNNVINTGVDTKMQQKQRNINNTKININSNLLDYLLERSLNNRTPILTREGIIGNTKAFSFAGQESTSTTLSPMFYKLSRSPDIVEKLRQEIDP